MAEEKIRIGKDGVPRVVRKIRVSRKARVAQHRHGRGAHRAGVLTEAADARRKFLVCLLGFFGVVIAGFVAWGVMMTLGGGRDGVKPLGEKAIVERDQYTALQVAEHFTSSTEIEERLKWARNPEQVRMSLNKYPEQALSAPVMGLRRIPAVRRDGRDLNNFQVTLEGGTQRMLCVEETPAGYRVDWDAYARYCSAPWSKILNGEVESAEVRVFAKPVAYFAYGYRDEEKWRCYVLNSPDLDQSFYAYTQMGSRTHRILRSALKNPLSGSPVTLRISIHPEGLQHRQLAIDEVLSLDWVVDSDDFEESWVAPFGSEMDDDDHTAVPRGSFE